VKYLLKNEPQSGCLNNGEPNRRGDGRDARDSDSIPVAGKAAARGRVGNGGATGNVPASRAWCRSIPRVARRRIGEHVVALIAQARLEHKFGANRTQIWLARAHDVRVATEMIQRVFRDIGVPHLVKTRRRRPKQLKLFEKNALAIPCRST
jgi:hypothetical protein